MQQGANLGEEVGIENGSGNHPTVSGKLTVTETPGCQPGPGPTAVRHLHPQSLYWYLG